MLRAIGVDSRFCRLPLDDRFVESESFHIKPGALIIDFLLLFLHALTFLVLSQLLKRPADFAWSLVTVLAIDVVWGTFTYFSTAKEDALSAESRWTIINFFFIAVVVTYLVSMEIRIGGAGPADPDKLAVLVAIACVVRSAVDYIWCRDLYFPR